MFYSERRIPWRNRMTCSTECMVCISTTFLISSQARIILTGTLINCISNSKKSPNKRIEIPFNKVETSLCKKGSTLVNLSTISRTFITCTLIWRQSILKPAVTKFSLINKLKLKNLIPISQRTLTVPICSKLRWWTNALRVMSKTTSKNKTRTFQIGCQGGSRKNKVFRPWLLQDLRRSKRE